MPDEPIVYECPGCGRPVQSGEDYVVALEYEAEPGFRLHHMTGDTDAIAERRFHVKHFRGQLGDRLFTLVHDQIPWPRRP